MENLRQKSVAADKMFDRLVAEMNNSLSIKRVDKFTEKQSLPSWVTM